MDVFSMKYSMANRQCQLWAGVFDVDPALKLQTTHAHRRLSSCVGAVCTRECGGARCRGSFVLMLAHCRQW